MSAGYNKTSCKYRHWQRNTTTETHNKVELINIKLNKKFQIQRI